MRGLVRDFDAVLESVAERGRGVRPLDVVMYGLSEAGNHSLLWHTVNLAQVIAGSQPDPRPGHTSLHPALRRSSILAVEQALVNGPMKLVFRRRRPEQTTVTPFTVRKPRTTSFPSGHATAGFCAAGLLARDTGHQVFWYTLAGLIAWSRVHVGVHHPSDVLGGAAIGLVFARVARRMWPPTAQSSPS